MDSVEVKDLLLRTEQCSSFQNFLDCFNELLQCNVYNLDFVTTDLIDAELLEEIRRIISCGLPVYFGKTMKDLKCTVTDENSRWHDIYVKYKGVKKLVITSVQLPHTPFLDKEYTTLEEIVTTFKIHVDNLAPYFYELERIDRFCTVVEPANATFKEDYRRVMLDDRVWLHVEVTPEGLATNVHLLGQGDAKSSWEQKLQVGLLNWNHDEDIVENIMTIFDMMDFPKHNPKPASAGAKLAAPAVDPLLCTICLCPELSGLGVPQPFCQNTLCGVYFHRICLFQWLVSSSGGRPPGFGVATGNCPTCFQPISCSENNS